MTTEIRESTIGDDPGRRSPTASGWSRARRYGAAVLVVIGAVALTLIPSVGPGLGIVIFFAVFLSAWIGGLGPGLLTTLLIALIALAGRIIQIAGGQPVPPWRFLEIGMFMAFGVMISALVEALHAARRRVETAERRQRLLAEVGTVLATSLDVEATHAALARLVVPDLADLCLIDMREPDGTIRRVAAVHADPARQPLADALKEEFAPDPDGPHPAMRALRTGDSEVAESFPEGLLAATTRDEAHLAVVNRLGFRSYMAVPLLARGRALGVLTLIATEGGRRFGPADLDLAEDLARRAALAIDNARLHHEAITAGRRAEAASRAKDRFLAMLSHELRTPLTPILAVASGLLDEPETPATLRPLLEMIRRNVKLEARLVDDLLDVTRIGRGQLDLERQLVDVHAVIGQALEVCRAEIDAGGIGLRLALDAAAHHVQGDPARLQQVVWNLIKNAVKYTPAGGLLTIRSRAGTGSAEGPLIIEVRDTGQGIAPEDLARIFEPFERGGDDRRRASGLGLGLAISRSLAEAHGGRLTAASAGPQRGATFTLELPTTPAVPSEPPAPTVAANGVPPGRSLKILLVEDNADTRRYLSWMLAQQGHAITTAGDLATALEVAAHEPPDLLISDIELPDGDGLGLMRTLRLDRPVVGIALSGFGSEEDVALSLAAGFFEHLTKPVDSRSLDAAIRRATTPVGS